MRDQHGRTIDYARISITDRCNLRCLYCLPEEGAAKLPPQEILSFTDILSICQALAALGITRLKVTGGEPLVRRDVHLLIRELKQIPGIEAVTLTTNGVLLAGQVESLKAAGLDGINVSLDTLEPAQYRRLTRLGQVDDVLAGIRAAAELAIPLKVNCVPVRGLNDTPTTLLEIASLAENQDLQVRFIEMMPLGLGVYFPSLDNRQVQALLEAHYGPLRPYPGKLGNGPACYYSLPGFQGKIGFISAVGSCFCERCNRIRITANGMVKPCLHENSGASLLPALASSDGRLLRETLRRTIFAKPEQHKFHQDTEAGGSTPFMSQIGG